MGRGDTDSLHWGKSDINIDYDHSREGAYSNSTRQEVGKGGEPPIHQPTNMLVSPGLMGTRKKKKDLRDVSQHSYKMKTAGKSRSAT